MKLTEILYKLDCLIEEGKQNTLKLEHLSAYLERIAYPDPEYYEEFDNIEQLEVEEFPEATEEEKMKLNFLRLTATELQFDHYVKQLKMKYNVL